MEKKVSAFDPQNYGDAIAALIPEDLLSPLGPGKPHQERRPQLEALDIQTAFAGRDIIDFDMAKCCLSGLWLLHNYLDASHTISQDVETTAGSYWHGIMHRREPDYSNSKYWFRRVGEHPIFAALCQRAKDLAAEHSADSAAEFLSQQPKWDPCQFIDLCEAAYRGRSKSKQLCLYIAQEEWRLLFEDCHRRALGA